MLKRISLAFVMAAALGGCVNVTSNNTSGVIECSYVDPSTGNLIALWMPMPNNKLQPVLVPHEYAIYIYWPNEEYAPNSADQRIFIFYDNVAKKCYQTKDYDAFLAVVAEQPRDITLLQIETCTVARCYMPKDQWGRLEKVLADGNRRWAVNPFEDAQTMHFCYCESTGPFVYPGDKH